MKIIFTILNIETIALFTITYLVYGVRIVKKASEVVIEDPRERHFLPRVPFCETFSQQYDTTFRVETRPNSSKRDA